MCAQCHTETYDCISSSVKKHHTLTVKLLSVFRQFVSVYFLKYRE